MIFASAEVHGDAITVIGRVERESGGHAWLHRDATSESPGATTLSSGLASLFCDDIPLFCRAISLFCGNVRQQSGVAAFIRCDVPQQNDIAPMMRRIVPLFCVAVPQPSDVSPLIYDSLPRQCGNVPLFRRDIPLFRGETCLLRDFFPCDVTETENRGQSRSAATVSDTTPIT